MKTINFKQKKKKLLTKDQQKSYENANIGYVCKEKVEEKHATDKINCKVRDHCHCLAHLNLKEITDTNYAHKNGVCKDFDMKKLGKHHDLYVQSVILLLANLLENFQNMSLEMNEFDPACFLTAWVSLASSLYNEHRDIEYFIEPDVQYPEKIHDFHNDLTFLSEAMKIQKIRNLAANLDNKKEYVIHRRNLKQVLKHRLPKIIH